MLRFQLHHQRLLADTITPVGLYLSLRDQFAHSLLLESSDYHSRENCFSFICLEPLIEFLVEDERLKLQGLIEEEISLTEDKTLALQRFSQLFQQIQVKGDEKLLKFDGFFGFTGFEGVQYFDSIQFDASKKELPVPELHYAFYRYIILFNHFKDELILLENIPQGDSSQLHRLLPFIQQPQHTHFPFETIGEEESNMTDEAFKEMVRKGKAHCQRGDVFQIVLSRRFSQAYIGDEFSVYRSLRSINPSPYLFFFDYGNYKIFGSSPEAQLIIRDRKAQIHPIAGTYKRTGDDEQDRIDALKLSDDPKENAEHIMLVDLARNDLSRHTQDVKVLKYRDVQYFSHVIHLVSKVEGKMRSEAEALQVFADTFPAGTLSGAPKYRAMQLIGEYEQQQRGFYGGAIGFMSLNGEINHAIIIRSFLAMNQKLYYQAGAGIVIDSDEEKELAEVRHKLRAQAVTLNRISQKKVESSP